MQDVIVAISIYFVAVILHVGLHRLLALYQYKTFRTAYVFIGGFIAVVLTILLLPRYSFFEKDFALPFASLGIYILLSLAHILFYTSPYWGEQSPSFSIYFLIKNRQKMSLIEIEKSFSDKQFIEARLTDLVHDGFVSYRNKLYRSRGKGKRLLSWIERYRKMLNWYPGG